MPQEKKFYEMPYHGQVMLMCPEKGGVRKYMVGTVSAIEVEAEFEKEGKPKMKDGKPVIVGWMATIIFGANLARKIGKGDSYNVDESGHTGAWHPPTEIEKTWPGVREAIALSQASRDLAHPRVEVIVEDAEPAPVIPVVPAPRRSGAQPRP